MDGQERDGREALERQSRRLETAYSIIQAVHDELSLNKLLDGIVESFVEEGGFSGAEISVDVTIGVLHIQHECKAGVASVDPQLTSETSMFIRGIEIGKFTSHYPAIDTREEQSELLEFLLPTLFMAIDHAVSFAEVLDYRATLEKRVEQRTTELREAHIQLSQTVEDLKEAKLSRDRFFANVNHEIRTPLTLIQLAADDVAGSREASAMIRERGEEIRASTQRLLHLVNSLLQLAAGQEGKLQIHPRGTDAAVNVRRLVKGWVTAAAHARVALSYDGPQECQAELDEAALDTVVGNLLSNAVKFTPAGGRVIVTMRATDAMITIGVRDTGVGIDPEFVPKLFGRFERSTSTSGIRGSGIGLALARELIELQHGQIRVVHHDDPRGTEFELEIPRHQAVLAVKSDRATLPSHTMSTAPAPESAISAAVPAMVSSEQPQATIVLAEDDAGLARQIASILSTQYKVLVASNGKDALELASRERPDLLVTDLDMPEMDGIELTQRFLQIEGMALSPVLIVSAHAGLGDRLAGFGAGAVDYVLKPFSAQELLARIRSQLAMRKLALRLHENEKLAALGVMSAGIAHELRNPANALINALEPLLMMLPDSAREPDSAGELLSQVVMTAGQQLRDRCRNILDLSRGGKVERRQEDLGMLLTRSRLVLRRQLAELTVTVRNEIAGPVFCAGPMIEQVLVNLLDNAAHAAGSGGSVDIAARIEGECVVVEVCDSGPGVPPNLRVRIFEPFYTTKPVGVGTGLGLSVSRRIAIDHGGDLRVVSRGDASAFRLELPQRVR